MRPIVIVKSSGQKLLPKEFAHSAIVSLLFGLVWVPSTSLPGDKNKSQIRLCHRHTRFLANTLRGGWDRPCSWGQYLSPRPLQKTGTPGKCSRVLRPIKCTKLLGTSGNRVSHSGEGQKIRWTPAFEHNSGLELRHFMLDSSSSLSMQAHSSQPPFWNSTDFTSGKLFLISLMLIHTSSDSDLNKDVAGSWGREPTLQPAVDSWPGCFQCLITPLERGFLMGTLQI